jgi:hypothetical protein
MKNLLSIGIAILAVLYLGVGSAAAQQVELQPEGTPGEPASITSAPGDPELVRDVDAPTAQPFRVELIASFGLGSPVANADVLGQVPAGKRLVVAGVSARHFEVPGSSFYLNVNQVLSSATVSYWLPGREIGMASSSLAVYIVSEQPRLVFEPGARVAVTAHRGQLGSMPSRGISVSVSGYFVDVP